MSRRRTPIGRPHVPHADPDAPGCCLHCNRPVDAGDRHVALEDLPDNTDAAAHDRAVLGERGDT